MGPFKKSLAGPGYVILNTIRVMNIISLLAVVTASVVMLVKTFIVSQFFFFDACSHIVTASLSISLIVTELPLFRGYVARNWPLLSPSSGFVTLGVAMIILGVSILGNLNKAATSEQVLGHSFWQIVISSGIVITILGVVNLIASYLFRNKSINVTARMVRCYGAVAPQKVSDIISHTSPSHSTSPARSVHLGRSDTLPSYYGRPKSYVSEMSRAHTTTTRFGGLNISAPMNTDYEQFAKFKGSAEVQRPDSAMHPAHGGRF